MRNLVQPYLRLEGAPIVTTLAPFSGSALVAMPGEARPRVKAMSAQNMTLVEDIFRWFKVQAMAVTDRRAFDRGGHGMPQPHLS